MTGPKARTRRRLMMLAAGPALAMVAAAQQPVRDAVAPPRSGTAQIAGRVITDDTPGRPVRHARLTLVSTSSTASFSAATDDEGRFVIRELPAGRFTLQATKAGFVSVSYGAKQPSRQGTSISVADGQRVDNITVSLFRGGVIAGTVRDQLGVPAPGVGVTVLQYSTSFMTGERTLGTPTSSSRQTTDDRGMYRAYGLPPGEYVVAATPRFGNGINNIRELTAADLQRLRAAAQSASGTAPAAVGSTTPAEPRTASFAPVFFPGTADPANAQSITIGPGDERSGVDMTLSLVPTARIEGAITWPGGVLPSSVQVTLAPATAGLMSGVGIGNLSSGRPDRDGVYAFPGVTPGAYTILARATLPAAPRAADGSAPTPPNLLWASAEVTIDGRDISVPLTMQPGMTVSGHLVFEGASQPPKNLTSLQVALQISGSNLALTVSPAQVGAKGRFMLTGVVPGKYRLALYGRLSDEGWWLQSAMALGRDTLDGALEVTSSDNIDDWTITFTDRPTELSGTLQDASGRPAPDYFIIAFPVDRSGWTFQSRRIAQTRPGNDGKYTIRGLPPGDYLIGAVTDVETNEWFKPAFLESLVRASVPLTLVAGEKKTKDLKLGSGLELQHFLWRR